MFSKPCARTGCPNPVRAETHYRLSRRICCSKSCAARHRIAGGWVPQFVIMDPEVRARACRKAGLVTAERRRKARAIAVVQRVSSVLGPSVIRGLEERQILALKVAITKAYIRGRKDGFTSGLDAARRKDRVA